MSSQDGFFSRRQRHYLIGRIYQLLKERKIKIVFLCVAKDEFAGETDHETIWLDLRREILTTFIHECLHIIYPDWSEEKVAATEQHLTKCLTSKQAKNLLKRLANYKTK
jgi:hypothetical protein